MMRCGCCQTLYASPEDLEMFSRLHAPGGKVWDICGRCVRAMWKKRAPKVETLA